MSDVVARLEALSRAEHDDLSVGQEAADEIKRLRLIEDKYIAQLEAAYDASDDDGGYYHDWQDAMRASGRHNA